MSKVVRRCYDDKIITREDWQAEVIETAIPYIKELGQFDVAFETHFMVFKSINLHRHKKPFNNLILKLREKKLNLSIRFDDQPAVIPYKK